MNDLQLDKDLFKEQVKAGRILARRNVAVKRQMRKLLTDNKFEILLSAFLAMDEETAKNTTAKDLENAFLKALNHMGGHYE